MGWKKAKYHLKEEVGGKWYPNSCQVLLSPWVARTNLPQEHAPQQLCLAAVTTSFLHVFISFQ